MKLGRSRGVREERTEHAQLFSRTLARSGLIGRQKVHFSTFDSKLELQCTRNGPQNHPYCPGSLQDTFIIYSSLSHQPISRKYLAKLKISIIENLQIQNPRFTNRSPDRGPPWNMTPKGTSLNYPRMRKPFWWQSIFMFYVGEYLRYYLDFILKI